MFFFFQAEDGIRDIGVTGVQTCAPDLWRCSARTTTTLESSASSRNAARMAPIRTRDSCTELAIAAPSTKTPTCTGSPTARSEERRVGKSVDLGGRRIIKKKNIVLRASS